MEVDKSWTPKKGNKFRVMGHPDLTLKGPGIPIPFPSQRTHVVWRNRRRQVAWSLIPAGPGG